MGLVSSPTSQSGTVIGVKQFLDLRFPGGNTVHVCILFSVLISREFQVTSCIQYTAFKKIPMLVCVLYSVF